MKRLFKKIFRVVLIIQGYLLKNECSFLRILEEEAMDYLESCSRIGVRNTEEIEDLIFHIRAYKDVPKILRSTVFTDIPKEVETKMKRDIVFLLKRDESLLHRYTEYITEIEKQRAVERLYIIECMKSFPFCTII